MDNAMISITSSHEVRHHNFLYREGSGVGHHDTSPCMLANDDDDDVTSLPATLG